MLPTRVVQDAVQLVDRVGVGRLVDRLDAAALVDGEVDDHRPRASSCATISSVTTTGARPPGTSTAPITRSASATARVDRAPVARERHDAALVDLVDPAQPVEVLVEQDDLGLHALRDPRRVPADVAGAEHDDARRAHAGGAAEQHAAAAVLALEEVRADLRAPSAPRPRSSARAAAARPTRAARSRRRCPVTLCSSSASATVRVRGEVEVGEEDEAGAQVAELLVLRLLDLQHDVGARPHVVGAVRRSRRRRAR